MAIRLYQRQDEEAIVSLSLRAWAPVFASLERELGPDLFVLLHGDVALDAQDVDALEGVRQVGRPQR